MRLNSEEKTICKHYGTKDDNGQVHCYECPLRLDYNRCKRNISAAEYRSEYLGED